MLGFFPSFAESAPEPVTERLNVPPLLCRNTRIFFPTFSESVSELVFEVTYVLDSSVWLGFDECVEKNTRW